MDNTELKYIQARQKKLLDQMADNSVAIVPGNNETIRNGDAHYSFRQDSSFYYLTGFNEPDGLAIFIKTNSSSDTNNKYVLFVRAKDPEREQWDGYRAGLDGAKDIYKADRSYDINIVDQNGSCTEVLDLLKNKEKIYYSMGCNDKYDTLVNQWLNNLRALQRKGEAAPKEIVNLDMILSEMRLIKDNYELDILRKICKISSAAHTRAMQNITKCNNEYHVEAELNYELNKHGIKHTSYTSIVGSGGNSCILHYVDNNKNIEHNSLVLIDAGGEYKNYAADITRTFPANGKFSSEQKAIYELVLKSQLAAIDEVKPGNTWDKMQQVILEVLTQGLVELGLIKNNNNNLSIEDLIKQEAYKDFYMHNSGHWLGLDVHDVGQYKINNKWRELQPGMVLTVEPGIYIKASLNVDPKWHNIGVRIEDDVLVTESGHEILTKDVPKQVHEIEELICSS